MLRLKYVKRTARKVTAQVSHDPEGAEMLVGVDVYKRNIVCVFKDEDMGEELSFKANDLWEVLPEEAQGTVPVYINKKKPAKYLVDFDEFEVNGQFLYREKYGRYS